MKPSRQPLILASLALLLVLAALPIFGWAMQPPYPYGKIILPGAVAFTLTGAMLAVLAFLAQRNRIGRRSWFVTTVVVIACLAVVLTPLTLRVVHFWRSWICDQWMQNLTIGLSMYSEDCGALPPASHWCDALTAYNKVYYPWIGTSFLACPERPDLRYGYAFNSALSGLRLEDVPDPEHTVLLFESDRGWNAAGDASLLPKKPRHGQRDYYGTALGGPARLFTRNEATGPSAKVVWYPKRNKR